MLSYARHAHSVGRYAFDAARESTIAPTGSYAEELSSLLDAAAALRSQSGISNRIDILSSDIVRDVLLNCGGLGYAKWSATVRSARCEEALARLMSRRARVPPPLLAGPGPVDIGKASLSRVEEKLAYSLHEGLHYLGSARLGGLHLGLMSPWRAEDPTALLALASLHPFDLQHLVPDIVRCNEAPHARVVSRLLALPGSPRNTLSRLLGEVFDWLRRHDPSVDLLVTYNNPNLGFRGTIYRATNWQLAGVEHKRRDMLLDGSYVSLRELKSRFACFCYADLKAELGNRLELLPEALQPLQVYVRWLGSRRQIRGEQ
jgi:hypothetical protein